MYYRRGERGQLTRPDTPSDTSSVRIDTARTGQTDTPPEGNFPLSVYRPRNRPHRVSRAQTESWAQSEEPVEQDVYAIQPRRPFHGTFSPHLRPDRRSTARLSAWKAPSFDDSLRSIFFARHNRQISLFCLGFLFPLGKPPSALPLARRLTVPAWMIASVLPLPPDPSRDPEHAHDATPSQVRLERQLAQIVGPVEDRSFQKAMWWRNLNRVMSGIGTLLIGAIVSCLTRLVPC